MDLPQKQLHDACAALDRALQSGHTARAESWLDACPALASDEDLALELVYTEYVTRESLGTAPRPDEYFDRFPQWENRLRRLFQVDDLLKTAGTAVDDDTATDAPIPRVAPPRVVAGFELREKLGGGGMGVVYRARQTKPARDVALKLLHAGSQAGATERARFRREAEAIARLQHPNIVAVYEVGDADGQPYLAMELVPGGDLHARLAGKPQPPAWAAAMVESLANAVHFAHEQGIVHRDIKPGNILLLGDVPKLTDFGLAALMESDDGLTRTGQVLGTLAYLAPEQAAATFDAALPSVDVYALGVVLYECLTGRPPFATADAAMLNMVKHAEPVPPRTLNPAVPRDLDTIVLKCLAKSPLKRYRTAKDLAEDLARHRANEPILARPAGWSDRAVKWSRRHPAKAASLVATVVGLMIVGAVVANYTTRLKQTIADVDTQRQRAEEQEIAAKQALAAEARHRDQTFAALEKLSGQLNDGRMGAARDINDQKRQLAETLETYQALAAQPGPTFEHRRAAAAALRHAAGIQLSLNRTKESFASFEEAVQRFRALMQEEPGNPENRIALARTLHIRSANLLYYKDHAGSYRDAMESVELNRTLPDADTQAARFQRAKTLNIAIVAARRAEMVAEADAIEKDAETLWRMLHEENPENNEYRTGLAGAHQTRAVDYSRYDRSAEAEASYRQATAIRTAGGRTLVGEERFHQADCYRAVAELCDKRGDVAAAIVERKAGLVLWEELHNERRNNVVYVRNFVDCLNTLIVQTQKPEEFEGVLQRIRNYLSVAAADAHWEIVVLFAGVEIQHGEHHYNASRFSESITAYTAASVALQSLLDRSPKTTSARSPLIKALVGAARCFSAWGRHEQAVDAWDAVFKKLKDPATTYRMDRAKALAGSGRVSEALRTATALDLNDDPILFLKMAALYALCAASTDGPDRGPYLDEAMVWFSKAHAKGLLENPTYRSYVQRGKDWRLLRDREEFKKIVE